MLKVFPCSTTHCLLSFIGTTLAEDLQAASKTAGGRRRQRWFWPTSRVSEEPKSYKLFLAHLPTGAPQPVGLNPRSSSFALSVARVRCREPQVMRRRDCQTWKKMLQGWGAASSPGVQSFHHAGFELIWEPPLFTGTIEVSNDIQVIIL